MKNLLYALLAFALASCDSKTEKPANILASNDFESLDGWTNGGANASLNKEKAHSGAFSVKTFPGLDFSMGFGNQLGKISSTRINKIKVHAWVYVPSGDATATLVVEVKNAGEDKNALWEGIGLVDEGKSKGYNKWIEVERTLTMPESINYNSQMAVYLWRTGGSLATYMDDVEITKVD